MTSVSKTVQQTLENPSSNMSVEEKELVLPYVFEKYRLQYREEHLAEGRAEGMAQGMAQGMMLLIRKFIHNNPEMTDEAIAAYFEVDIALVNAARQQI